MPRVSLGSLLLASSLAVACGDASTPEGAPLPIEAAGGAEQQPSSPVIAPPSDAAAGSGDSAAVPPGADTGGAGGAESAPAPVFCDAPAKIFVPSCGIGACHENPAAAMSAFAVDTTSAYNFVDKVSTRHAECGRIIDSRDYSQSLLLLKIQGAITDPVLCGGIMPIPSYAPLSATQIDCVASWLQQFQR
jgi:hypothetical protein